MFHASTIAESIVAPTLFRPELENSLDPFRKLGTGINNTGGAESIPVCWWIGRQGTCIGGRLTIPEVSIWTFVKATAMRRQFGP